MTTIVSVRDYLRLIFRRKAVLLLPILASAALIGPVWFVVPPKYRTAATVRRHDLQLLQNAPGAILGRGASGVSHKTLRVEILTWTNLDRVIRQLKLDVDLKTAADWQAKYQELQRCISIGLIARDRAVSIVEIASTSSSPKVAQEIANAIADNYVEESKRAGRQATQTAVDFLRDGALEYLQRLRETETELDKFHQLHYDELPRVKQAILGRLSNLRTNKTARVFQLAAAKTRLEETQRQLKEVPMTVKSDIVKQPNPSHLELVLQLENRKRLLDMQLTTRTDEHPDVIRVRNEIASIEERLKDTPKFVQGEEHEIINSTYQQLQIGRLTLEQEIRGHQATLIQIGSEILANEKKIRNVVKQEKSYNDLKRQEEQYSEVYREYRKNLTAAQTRLQMERGKYGTQVDMIARALEPAFPYRIDRLKIAGACLLGGLLLGIALMFTLEFCDRSLRSTEDAAAFLDVPVLASVTTIVLPEEMRAKRRWRYILTGVLIFVVVGTVVALLLWNYLQPGALKALMQAIRLQIG